MLLRITETDDWIALEGEIDMAVADEALEALTTAAKQGTTVVDLSGVTFMDSSGLNMLLTVARDLNGNGPLVVRQPSEPVRKLFSIALPNGAPGMVIADDPR